MADTPQQQPHNVSSTAPKAAAPDAPVVPSPMAATDAMNAAMAVDRDSILLFRDVSRLAGDGLAVETVEEASKKALEAYKREREAADKAEEEVRAQQEAEAKKAEDEAKAAKV